MPNTKLPVAVLGATGAVGQRFVQLLAGHPWFELAAVTASGRSAGKAYGDACSWLLRGGMPPAAAGMPVLPTEPGALPAGVRLVFSALPGSSAAAVEEDFARAGHAVCSNASSHRMDPDVPLLIPDVNPDHAALIPYQQAQRGWAGFIVTNPNCTTTHLVCALKPLHDAFGLAAVSVVTLQAISGAGYPGVSAMDILDNVIPNIDGEEAKIESEPQKLLGALVSDSAGDGSSASRVYQVRPASFAISAQANRVAVRNGHLIAVTVKLRHPAALADVAAALVGYRGEPQRQGFPSAPDPAIILHTSDDRPQPRLDRLAGNGMVTQVGRLRPDAVLDYKFIVLGHNTIRGAAGGALLNAELLLAQGYLAQ